MDTFPIFQKLGGEQAACGVVEHHTGWRPTTFALKKWKHERRLSAKVSLALSVECASRGIPFDLSDFRLPAMEAA